MKPLTRSVIALIIALLVTIGVTHELFTGVESIGIVELFVLAITYTGFGGCFYFFWKDLHGK